MYHARLLLTTLIIVGLIGCAPSINRMHYRSDISTGGTGTPAPYCDVEILEQDGPARLGTLLGTMKIDDSGVSRNCGTYAVMKILREEACRIGADVIVLYNITRPDLISPCYRVMADFVRLDEGEEYTETDTDTDNENAAADAPVLPDGDYDLPEPTRTTSPSAFEEIRPCIVGGSTFLVFIIGFVLFNPLF